MKQSEKPLLRTEYIDKLQEICESGNIVEPQRSTVLYAFCCVNKPEQGIFLSTWKKYKRSIRDVPSALRKELDSQIIDNLISEEKLSSADGDYLLRALTAAEIELSAADARIRKIEDDRNKEAADKTEKERNEWKKSVELRDQKARERQLVDGVKVVWILSVSLFVLILVWNGFTAWVNDQSTTTLGNEDEIVPGLGISASEYERRSNCRLYGC
jgi:hypothetical protein